MSCRAVRLKIRTTSRDPSYCSGLTAESRPGEAAQVSQHIIKTTLRPESTKTVIILELTVPWENRLEEVYGRKRAKYEGLVIDSRKQGWKDRCMPIEVGCRGFARQSLYREYRALCIN